MKERNAYQRCPECGYEINLSGCDIGGQAMLSLPIHRKEGCEDPSDPHNSMILGESLSTPDICHGSESLVPVSRPDETK